MPPSSSGTPRIGRPISSEALSSASGAVQVSLASLAAGRTISSANSPTTSASICSSSPGVRSKSPVFFAEGTRLPRVARPARAKVRPTLLAVRNPALVTR